jgi:Fur family ferric uptake transcriptional regulator
MTAMTARTSGSAPAGPGRRDTRQRRLLRDQLSRQEAFVSAQQMYDDLRASGDRVGLATVYRTLQAMTEAGELDVLRSDDGEVLYRQCGPQHHHHLVCRSCGVTVEVDGPAVEKWAVKAAETHGFTEVRHVVELFGLCAACSRS